MRIEHHELTPVLALIAYHCEGEVYMESMDIVPSGNTFELTGGVPLSEKTLRDVKKLLASGESSRMSLKGMIPKNLIYWNDRDGQVEIIWHREAQPTYLHFVKGLEIPSGEVHLFDMIFHVKGSGISVYAVKEGTVEGQTRLFQAPFHNVTASGDVCTGTGQTPKDAVFVEDLMADWEHLFFGTEFSHMHGADIKQGENLNLVYRSLIGTGQPFPLDVLLPTNLTVNHLLP
jgi:PRTRC genetic system protein B